MHSRRPILSSHASIGNPEPRPGDTGSVTSSLMSVPPDTFPVRIRSRLGSQTG